MINHKFTSKGYIAIIIIIIGVLAPLNNVCLSIDTVNTYPLVPIDIEIQNALQYLKNQQGEDGSIAGITVSSWAAIAIASANEDLSNWTNLIKYLKMKSSLLDPEKATDWERHTLAIVACNENPRDFAGIDFVAKILQFYDGNQIGDIANIYDDSFGILSLISSGIDKNETVIKNTKQYILNAQDTNGGWGDADSTAAAIIALISAGQKNDSNEIINALSFLKTLQHNNGGFHSWGDSNAASTSWTTMALLASGEDPTSHKWTINQNNPISYLLGLQQDTGGFNWSEDQHMNPEWMTSYIIPALLGKYYPIAIYDSSGSINHAPETPIKPQGHTMGKAGISYTFKTVCTDIDGDKVQYRFDWDANRNHEYSTWTTLDNSGIIALVSHIWNDTGIYALKVQARDEHGLISNWSEKFFITIKNEDYFNTTDEWSGFIRIEGKDDTIWMGSITVGEISFHAKNGDTGEAQEYCILFPCVLGALIKALENTGFSYEIEYWPSWDTFLVKTINDDSDWWHYLIDYELSMIGAGEYELTDQDSEIIWGYLENLQAHALQISIDKSEIKKDEEFTIHIFDETDNSVNEAIVTIGTNTYTTNHKGYVTIKLSDIGSYTIYAEKEGYIRSDKKTMRIQNNIEILKPTNNALYIANMKLFANTKNTWIVGPITIQVNSINDVEKVEFYVNDVLEFSDDEQPFEYLLNKKSLLKKTDITLVSYVRENISEKILDMLKVIIQLLDDHQYGAIFEIIHNFTEEFQSKQLLLSDTISMTITILNIFPNLHEMYLT